MEILFSPTSSPKDAALILGCFQDKVLTSTSKEMDKALGGLLTKALDSNKFKGSKGETLTLTCPQNSEASRLILIGLGKKEDLSEKALISIGGALFTALKASGDQVAEIHSSGKADPLALVAYGALLRSWTYEKFKTKMKEEKKLQLKTLRCITTDDTAASEKFNTLKAVADGVFFTRELVTLPPNLLYPATMADRLTELESLGVKVEVLGEAELKKLGMGSLLGVGQGSVQESKVVVMQWMGGKKDVAPVAFIGKGVTFDTGGISIKPSQGMEDMKYDMAGAGAVSGLMKALAGRKAAVNAIGVVGLVENMPSGSAQRPSDIVTSMSGQTIEVLNTDAEGRLVLADVLWYTQERFKPQFMVNLATLTGAIVIALGDQYAGLFSNNDALCSKLTEAGEKTDERLWRLPLSKEYDKDIDSDIADVKNISNGRKAGSITAAQFLQRFVNDTPWAHLDIAGTAWADKAQSTCEKGATGFGVRLLDQLVRDHYEN